MALSALSRGDPAPFAQFFREGVRFSADDWQALANMIPEPTGKRGRGRPVMDKEAAERVLAEEGRYRKAHLKRVPRHFRQNLIRALALAAWHQDGRYQRPAPDEFEYVTAVEQEILSGLEAINKKRERAVKKKTTKG
jgi:hypothetical protein